MYSKKNPFSFCDKYFLLDHPGLLSSHTIKIPPGVFWRRRIQYKSCMEGSHKQEELQNLLVRVNNRMYICTQIVTEVLKEQTGSELMTLLRLEHGKKPRVLREQASCCLKSFHSFQIPSYYFTTLC